MQNNFSETTHLHSGAHEYISMSPQKSPLMQAVEEIAAHLKDRYKFYLKPDKADLSYNEMCGIIAKNVLVPAQEHKCPRLP